MDATDELNELKKLYFNEEERQDAAPEQASPVQGEVASEAEPRMTEGLSAYDKPQSDSDADNPSVSDGEAALDSEPAAEDAPAPSVILSPQGEGSPAESNRAEEEGDSSSEALPPSRNDSDTDSPAPEKKKRRIPRFWKIYAITVAVVIMLICGLLGFFRIYLGEYEQTRPLNAAKEAVAALAAGEDRPGFIPAEAGEFDKAASVAAAFARAGGTAGAEVVEKVGVSTEQTPVFSVREDGREICTVRLREGEKRRFFREWLPDGVFFTGDNAVDITLTSDTRLFLNGVPVGESYAVSHDAALPGYEDFGDVTPDCVRYQIEGLFYEPELTLENDYCYPKAELKNGVWLVSYPGAESNRADAVKLAYSAAQAYIVYASSNDSPLAPLDKWLIPGSTLRARVLSFDRRYFTRHDSADFKNMRDLDFSVYGADQFSVKLSFDYVMRYGKREQTDASVMTLYMLRLNGEWKLSDVAVE